MCMLSRRKWVSRPAEEAGRAEKRAVPELSASVGTQVVGEWGGYGVQWRHSATRGVWHWASQADQPRVRGGFMDHDESTVAGCLPAFSRVSTRTIPPNLHL